MHLKDEHYFIEFANQTTKHLDKMYEDFPIKIVDEPDNWPGLAKPIQANLDSLLWACRGANMCPIPERMILFAKSFHESLRKILDKVIADGKVLESDELNFIINLQQRLITKYEFANGQLIEKTMPNPDDECVIMVTPGWLKYSCRSLLDYLCEGNLKQLKRCPYCRKYFIAKDSKRKICYEKKCLNNYHRSDMKKRRDTDPVKYC
jgi:hypothetical protein